MEKKSEYSVHLVNSNASSWNKLIQKIPSDTYHYSEYLSLCSQNSDKVQVVMVKHDDDYILGIPLIISQLPYGFEGFDACSPYGYASPIGDQLTEKQLKLAIKAVFDFFKQRKIISLFIRFHPLLNSNELMSAFSFFGKVNNRGDVVYIDLFDDKDAICSQVRPRFRTDINKLKRNGWRFCVDDWSYINDFFDIYNMTMRRNEAQNFYYFSLKYFEGLRDKVGEKVKLHMVLDPDGHSAAGGIFLDNGNIVQYHLGGTNDKYLKFSPSKLLFHEAILWHKMQKAQYFIFGGGYGCLFDGLFNFKSGFSKKTLSYYTGSLVIDAQCYDKISAFHYTHNAMGVAELNKFFPAYRDVSNSNPSL